MPTSRTRRRTEFVGYEQTEVLTRDHARYAELGDGLFQVKLEQSPFYPAGGGQVADTGMHREGRRRARGRSSRRYASSTTRSSSSAARASRRATASRPSSPWNVRFPTQANHTGTHLLHECLREVLGDARQAGRLRRASGQAALRLHASAGAHARRSAREVERRVNERVFENLPVRIYETPIDEARKLGAMMLFGEKYGDIVRVVDIGGWSVELCGGTHVRSTAEIGPFAILSESSVGSGARRIEAVTAGEAFAYLHEQAREADELRVELERVAQGVEEAGAERSRGRLHRRRQGGERRSSSRRRR